MLYFHVFITYKIRSPRYYPVTSFDFDADRAFIKPLLLCTATGVIFKKDYGNPRADLDRYHVRTKDASQTANELFIVQEATEGRIRETICFKNGCIL